MSTTYNGWKNRATWAVGLWLANDEPTYRRIVSVVANADRDPARAVERWVRNEWANLPTLMRIDIGTNLSDIDWASVAAHFTDEEYSA